MIDHALIDVDLKRTDLADLVGWSPQRLNNYLRGERKPGIQELIALRRKLPTLPGLATLLKTVSEDARTPVGEQILDQLEHDLKVSEMRDFIEEFNRRYGDADTAKGKVTPIRRAAGSGRIEKAKGRPRRPQPTAEPPQP